jgi:hypothetical protein
MMTASHKKSVPDYDKQKVEIGLCADKILELFKHLPHYRQEVTQETLFPPEGSAHLQAATPHYVIDSHTDPFIHLGNVVFTIHRLRDYLLSDLGVTMSAYLMYEMIYVGLDESNNMLRYCKFADLHYNSWRDTRSNPVPKHSSFLDCYQIWLRSNYPANDGKAGANGGADEGAVRYGPSNNTARMVATCHRNVRALLDVIQTYSKKKVSESAYGTMLNTLNKNTLGSGELKLQKMIYAVACCDENFPVDWLRYCKPGSKEHFDRMKERKYNVKNNFQVGQIVKAIAKKDGMLASKAEHSLCVLLSNKDSKDVIIGGYDLFFCKMDSNGVIDICRLDARDGKEKRVSTGGFEYGENTHYYPEWAHPYSTFKGYGLRARFPNAANLEFNVVKKKTVPQKKALDDEQVLANEETMSVEAIQTLLTKNRSLAITDPLGFAADYCQLSRDVLKSAIMVSECASGFSAVINTSVFDYLIFRNIRQISDMKPERRPVYDLKQRTTIYNVELATSEETWFYKTRSGAVISMLLHLLLNVQPRSGVSWSLKYLVDTKELILLVPSGVAGTMEVVGVIFRQDNKKGTKVLSRLFDTTGKALSATVIGKDNIGAFDGSFLS